MSFKTVLFIFSIFVLMCSVMSLFLAYLGDVPTEKVNTTFLGWTLAISFFSTLCLGALASIRRDYYE